MKITVTLYGRYTTIAKTSQIHITIPDKGTIWHIIEAFTQQYPEATKDKPRMMVTKNQQLASPETPVSPKDSISIAPPLVAGG
jgi:molybdopterin converting factor small subunit